MIFLIIIVAVLLFVFMPQDLMMEYGVSNANLLNSWCYMLMHVSWLHLFINVLSVLMMWFPIRRLYIMRYNTESHALHVAAYLASVLAGLVCAADIPTVGMSGCVFFLLGVLLMLNPTKRQALNYLWIVATLFLQWYFGKSNVALHVFAFVEGCLFVIVREFIYQYTNDTGLFGPDKQE